MSYTYSLSQPALELFSRCTLRDRQRLLTIFEQLAENPFVEGEFACKDTTGREQQIVFRHKWRVVFWPDHFAAEVRISKIERLK